MKKLLAMAIVAAGIFAALPSHAEDINIGDTLYVGDDVSVWQETNGKAGLQRVAADGFAADTRLA